MDLSSIWYYLKEYVTYIVPLVALLISIISLCKSAKGQKLQIRVNELELKLKQDEVSKIEKKKADAGLACIEARAIETSSGKYKLKIWNSGQATAYKVSAIIDQHANLRIVKTKMPFDFLDAGKGFEEHLGVHLGTPGKFQITTTWEVAAGRAQKKEQMCSL